jgi:hypothetical protein
MIVSPGLQMKTEVYRIQSHSIGIFRLALGCRPGDTGILRG